MVEKFLNVFREKRGITLQKSLQLFVWAAAVLFLLACCSLFQPSTVVQEDLSSTTVLTLGMDKALLNDANLAAPWQGQVSATAISRNGDPHISYYDERNEDLKYTYAQRVEPLP